MFSFTVNVLAFTSLVQFTAVPEIHAKEDTGFKNNLLNDFELKASFTAWLWKPQKSMVGVPFLMRMCLCKLATAAHGPAKHELMQILDYSRKKTSSCESEVTDTLALIKNSDLLLLNKMYVNYSSDIAPQFIDQSTSQFGVHVDKVPFNKPDAVIKYINNWFDRTMFRRTPDIVNNKDVGRLTSILLVSAAHIQTTWELAFDIEMTKPVTFKGVKNKDLEILMMSKTDSFMYYADLNHNFKIIQTKLLSFGLSMTFVLPDRNDGLPRLISNLAAQPQVLQDAKSKMRYTEVFFSIPRFKIKTTWDWDQIFWKMGIRQIFNWTMSGLDAILRSRNDCKTVYLSKARQKVFFEVDEYGVFRNPARAQEYSERRPIKLFRTTRNPNMPEFVADHPFLFTLSVQLSPSGSHNELAVGVYYGPDKL